jgi:hypothetical protein
MEIWILAALAGWCPTGWPRWVPRRPRWPWWWPVPPIPDPPGPRPEEGPRPEPWQEGPHPEPWEPIVSGILGAVGGIAAWAILGGRFGGDGGLIPVAVIGFLGGCVGLSVAETIQGLRSRGQGAARRG